MNEPLPEQERRIHKVYVTRNTEYHVRRNVCIAVLDRKSGRRFRTGHKPDIAGCIQGLVLRTRSS